MNTMTRRMLRKLLSLPGEFKSEHRAHLDRFHELRDRLQDAEKTLRRAQERHDEIVASRYPREQQARYMSESAEEIDDARNVVDDIKSDIGRCEARMQSVGANRDRAEKLAKALIQASGATHHDFPSVDFGPEFGGSIRSQQ